MRTNIPEDISPYRLLRNSLRSGGYMINDGKPWSLIYTAIHLFLMSSLALLPLLDVIIGDETIEKKVMAMSFFAESITLSSKLIIMALNENKFRRLLERLEKYRLNLLADEQYRSHIIEADNICTKIAKYFTLLVLTYPFVAATSNVLKDYLTNSNEHPHFSVQMWLPWNINGFWSYILAATYEVCISTSGCLIYASCGAFQFTFTYQMSAYLKVLQNRLIDNGPTDKSIYQQHNTLNQLLLDYIDIFSKQQFIEILVASLMPCGFGYTVMKGFKNNNPPQLGSYHMLALCLLGPFFVYNCGQEISDQMEKLHDSSYFSKWYEEKPKVRRDLYTMMLVTVRPVTINYKMFIRIDRKCGTAIVQGLYSYLMMVNNFETAD